MRFLELYSNINVATRTVVYVDGEKYCAFKGIIERHHFDEIINYTVVNISVNDGSLIIYLHKTPRY